MRKINKIMMSAVSILLTLVLISSCVLSGIFAKYVTTKTAKSVMKFAKFGVTVEVSTPISSLSAEQKEALGLENVTVTNNAGSNDAKSGIYTITISNLPIRPGVGTNPNGTTAPDVYSALVKFAFEGSANVPVRVTLRTEIDFGDVNWTVPGDIINKSDTTYLPLGFTMYAYNGENHDNGVESYFMGSPWRTGATDTTADNRAEIIAKNFAAKLARYDALKEKEIKMTQNGKDAYLEFGVNDSIQFRTADNTNTPDDGEDDATAIAQGIMWPLNAKSYNSKIDDTTGNTVDTWFSETQGDKTITITYTVKVEQTGAA